MPNNPKIKVDADLSTVDSEIARLKQTIGQLGDQLKTQSGKTHFNFEGAQKELDALIARADKLTAALGNTSKNSGQYVKNLKDAKEAMEAAAKMAAKLEDAGTARTSKASNYFRNYAAELTEEAAEASKRNAEDRERSAREARQAAEAQARNNRWSGNATRFAGAVAGTVMGGGGSYANIGSMLGASLGPIGGFLGGMVGGAADRFISPAREEAKLFSELRRMVGSTTTDFDNLRDSVRSVIHGMGVTDNEAANLAKQFAHTASLTGDANNTIARSIGTSAGFAQGYGMSPSQATAFFAQMRLTGSSNNDKDNRRLALMIGESVQRGGTSAKMDAVLSAVASFATRSAQQMLTAPNVGQYSSYLASLTGSPYAGIKGDPNNSAQLMAMMDASVSSGGNMGEASQFHWLQARQSAFKGMSALDNSLMQTAGATGDLVKLFSPGSPSYDNANPAARARMDRTRESIADSGYRNNFQVGMAHIKAISRGDSYLENANFRAMFGGNPQQAAALMLRMSQDPGLGGFEKELSRYGINLDNVNVSQISSLSQLLGGGSTAMSAQYEKLLGSGKLSKGELDMADKVMARDGYGEEFKRLLINLTAKYDADDGLRSQTSMIDISNKIQEGVSSLVSIETDVREYMLRLLNKFGAAGPILNRMTDSFMAGLPEDGTNMAGGKGYGFRSKSIMMREVRRSLSEIAMAGSQEAKDAAYNEVMSKVSRFPRYYPAQMGEWAKRARGGHEIMTDKKVVGPDNDLPTLPGSVPGSMPISLSKRQRDIVNMTRSPSKYDDLFEDVGRQVGLDPMIIKQIAATESGLNPKARNENRNGTVDLGMMQHNSRYAGGRGINADNWQNPYQNVLAGAKYYKQLLARYGGDVRKAMKHYNGSGPDAERYADTAMGVYDALHTDRMPEAQRRAADPEKNHHYSSKHEIMLYDRDYNLVADPVTVSTRFGAPLPAGG